MYIMHRTQIYLSDREDAILRTESGRTGLSRSELIRDAIRRTYHVPGSYADFKGALDAASGAIADAPFTGEEYVALIRTRGFGALAEVWPEYFGESNDAARPAR